MPMGSRRPSSTCQTRASWGCTPSTVPQRSPSSSRNSGKTVSGFRASHAGNKACPSRIAAHAPSCGLHDNRPAAARWSSDEPASANGACAQRGTLVLVPSRLPSRKLTTMPAAPPASRCSSTGTGQNTFSRRMPPSRRMPANQSMVEAAPSSSCPPSPRRRRPMANATLSAMGGRRAAQARAPRERPWRWFQSTRPGMVNRVMSSTAPTARMGADMGVFGLSAVVSWVWSSSSNTSSTSSTSSSSSLGRGPSITSKSRWTASRRPSASKARRTA